MSRPAYPKYKPSGVEWLGDVPEHWEIERCKFTARTIMGQSPNSTDYTFDEAAVPFLQGNAEFGLKHPSPKCFCNAATKTAPQGSLLVSVRAPVGALNIADQPYGIGRGLCAVVPNPSSLVPRYAWHLFVVSRHELWSIATGSTYEAVSVDEVANMVLTVPPVAEQRAIAAFLDRETGRIDALIAKKERQIELLREKRAALISSMVTGQLSIIKDPENGRLRTVTDEEVRSMTNEQRSMIIVNCSLKKDSGIEWLGQIPAHWEMWKAAHILRLHGGHAPESVEIQPEGCHYFKVDDLNQHGEGQELFLQSSSISVSNSGSLSGIMPPVILI